MSSPFANLFDNFKDGAFSFNAKTFDFYTLNKTSDGQGGYTDAWVLFQSAQGFIFPMDGAEAVVNDRLLEQRLFKVLIKPISGLLINMKLTYNGEDYNINSIADIAEDGSLMRLVCQKLVAL